MASLIDVNGTLYGTTVAGGKVAGVNHATGTVFRISTSGKEKVVYSFGKAGDAWGPEAGLLYVNGTLYGTTRYGGAAGTSNQGGTVFSVTTSGKNERVLHSFLGLYYGDGAVPLAGLTATGSPPTLYGTTSSGGGTPTAGNLGTVYSISPDGSNYNIVHAFGTGELGKYDGAIPVAPLTVGQYANGLFGTTEYGGFNGEGTYYEVTPLDLVGYNFPSRYESYDGFGPQAGVTEPLGFINPSAYTTTSSGGLYEGGTVVYVTFDAPDDVVLHSFGQGTDGLNPAGTVILVTNGSNSTLYGTTTSGGAYGLGTVFSIDTSGQNYRVLHDFKGGLKDGSTPMAGLIDVNGVLYGTTTYGGKQNGGTVFAITP